MANRPSRASTPQPRRRQNVGAFSIRFTFPMYRRRIAQIGARRVTLRRNEAEVLSVLLILRGRPVTVAEMIPHIWEPDDEPGEAAEPFVYVAIRGLRRKGFPIGNATGGGYVIERPSVFY